MACAADESSRFDAELQDIADRVRKAPVGEESFPDGGVRLGRSGVDQRDPLKITISSNADRLRMTR